MYTDSANNTADNRRDTIRQLSGSLDDATATNEEIDQSIERGDQWVNAMTGKDDWTSSDTKWSLVISASNYRAAAETLDSIPTREAVEAARMKRADAKDLIKIINEKEPDAATFHFTSAGPNIADHLEGYKYEHRLSDWDYIGTV